MKGLNQKAIGLAQFLDSRGYSGAGDTVMKMAGTINRLEAENAALREKLAAAIEDIKRMDRYIAKSDDPYAALCEVCKYKPQNGGKCKRCDVHDNAGFKWRGGQEGSE